MSNSGYYILVMHYYLVGPVPRRGAPHASRPAALRLPRAGLPKASVVGRPAASRVFIVRQGPGRPRGEPREASRGSTRPSGGRRAEGPAPRPERLGPAIATGFQDGIGSRMRSRHDRHRTAASPGLRMALDVFPNRHLCEGVQAEPLALAEESYRREFRLAKNRDDPIQTNTARRGDKFGGYESLRPHVS